MHHLRRRADFITCFGLGSYTRRLFGLWFEPSHRIYREALGRDPLGPIAGLERMKLPAPGDEFARDDAPYTWRIDRELNSPWRMATKRGRLRAQQCVDHAVDIADVESAVAVEITGTNLVLGRCAHDAADEWLNVRAVRPAHAVQIAGRGRTVRTLEIKDRAAGSQVSSSPSARTS